MNARVSRAAVLAAMCAATIGPTASCGGGTLPGDPVRSQVTTTPNGTPAHPYTAAWLDDRLLTEGDLSGSKVVKADCRPQHVDAGGAGEYDCVVTMDDGHKVDHGFEVSSGLVTPLDAGIPLN
jgi:hypothetical protein